MLQILRIGANIINQYGSYTSANTFYPAVIEFKEPLTGDYWRACGVENLPNVSSMTTVVGDNWAAAGSPDEPTTFTGSGPTAFTVANMQTSATGLVYLMFGLWNPNQVSSDSTNAGATPPSVRLHVKGYYGLSCYYGATSLPTLNVAGTSYPGYDFPSQIDSTLPLQATAGTPNGVYGFANSGVITSSDVALDLLLFKHAYASLSQCRLAANLSHGGEGRHPYRPASARLSLPDLDIESHRHKTAWIGLYLWQLDGAL